MTVSKLKALLDGFNDNDDVAVAITVNDAKFPVVTHDIGFGENEHGGLMLEVTVYDADFDYQSQ